MKKLTAIFAVLLLTSGGAPRRFCNGESTMKELTDFDLDEDMKPLSRPLRWLARYHRRKAGSQKGAAQRGLGEIQN